MPIGRVWECVRTPGTTARKLLSGFASENIKVYNAINAIDDMIPDVTTTFLGEWESALRIPDDCLFLWDTDELRRRNIQIKLSSLGVQTVADFQDFAVLFGLAINITSGVDHLRISDGGYETASPVLEIATDFATIKEARNTIVVIFEIPHDLRFRLNFIIPFTNQLLEEFTCLLTKLKPATSNILFIET